MARYAGVVSHLDDTTGFGELTVEGMQPLAVSRVELRAIDCDRIGARLSFEIGTVPHGGQSGATRLFKAGTW
jgi:hypothetical protein